jgi:transposase
MAKFTFEEKLLAVKEYEKGCLSYRDSAKKLGTLITAIEMYLKKIY